MSNMRILDNIDENLDILVRAPTDYIKDALRDMCDGIMNDPALNDVGRKATIDMIIDRFNQACARRDAKTVH